MVYTIVPGAYILLLGKGKGGEVAVDHGFFVNLGVYLFILSLFLLVLVGSPLEEI